MIIKPPPASILPLSAGATANGNPVPVRESLLLTPLDAARAGKNDLSRIAAAEPQAPPLWRSTQESLEVLLSKAVAGDGLAADSLWIELTRNFGLSIPGAQVLIQDARTELSLPIAGGMPSGQKLIEEALERLGPERASSNAGKFVEIRYKKRNYHHRLSVRELWRHVEYVFGSRLQLVTDATKDTQIIRLATPSFFEAALQAIFGPRSVHWKYVSGEVPHDHVVEAYEIDQRVVGFTLKSIWLGDVKGEVHPALFPIHDVYHGAFFASLHEIKWAILELYYALRNLPDELKNHRHYELAMDRLVDLEFGKPNLPSLVNYVFGDFQGPTDLRNDVSRDAVSPDLFEAIDQSKKAPRSATPVRNRSSRVK